MDSSQRSRRRQAFLEMMAAAGELPSSGMASAYAEVATSQKSRRAAEVMIGSLQSSSSVDSVNRVARLAHRLDALAAALRTEGTKTRRSEWTTTRAVKASG